MSGSPAKLADAPSAPPAVRAPARTPRNERPGLRLLGVRVCSYLTNHAVNHVPSYAVRHAWYRRVLGARLDPSATVHLGCYVWFLGPGQIARDGLEIGANTRINRDCCLDARARITIGANVSISPQVAILTGQHDVRSPDFTFVTAPVRIDDNVFVGTRATIMPGVSIGRGAVVAAGAVVTRDVAPYTIVGGVPARPIGARGPVGDYSLDDPRPLFE